MAGVVLDRAARVRLAHALDELHPFEIEAGMPAVSDEDAAAIKEICAAGLQAKISVLCRALPQDVDLALSLGAWGVRLSFPISRVERDAKLKGIGDEEYLERALEITQYARDAGAYVIFSPYDTTRADPAFLLRVVTALEGMGTVDRLRVVDTTGCALPEGIAALITLLRDAAPTLPMEIHCHDDFGLACANTVAGAVAGAGFVSTTMNGIGERSGNAATEEVALTLEALYGIDTGLDLTKLVGVSRLVEELSGVPTAPNKAVVGLNSFRHEAGMVVAGVLKEPFTAEAYAPELVGQRRQILIGKGSGLQSIAHKVDELGLAVPDERFADLLTRVKEEANRHRRALTDDEFAELALGQVASDDQISR
jgi:isopropylmalate/homocitrate/citramalate synthase